LRPVEELAYLGYFRDAFFFVAERIGHAGFKVRLQDIILHGSKRGADGADLLYDFRAIAALRYHFLHSIYLPRNAIQARHFFVVAWIHLLAASFFIKHLSISFAF
jgi:hypothetical protein